MGGVTDAHRKRISSASFSPDGARIVSGSRGSIENIKIWGTRHNFQRGPLPTSGRVRASHAVDESMLVFVVEKQNAHVDFARTIDFTRDGARIVSGSNDKSVKIWGAFSSTKLR